MKRTTAIAVLVTAAVLVLAGNAPRLPWDAAFRWLRSRISASATWPERTRLAPPAGAAAPAPAWHVPRLHVPALHLPALPHAAALPRVHVPALPAPPRFAPGLLAALAAGSAGGIAIALLLIVALRVLDRRGRESRRTRILRLARDGRAPARIARDAHVARDAVRTLLAPAAARTR